jgi:antitoxin (DNA-binding transcriptional repressor) of toxin-antitoxin stability system
MSHVKTATVRDLRNDFARVSRWIQNGEVVTVTKGGRPFATLLPFREAGSEQSGWPDLAARRRAVFDAPPDGTPLSEIVSEQRGDR